MPRHDRFEMIFGDMEDFRDTAEEGELTLVDQAIRLGDMKKAVDDAFQHLAIIVTGTAKTGQPLRIGFVTRNVLTCEVIKTGNVFGFFFRKIENLPEGPHLASLTMPSAFAILAESAMMATEKETLRRVSGSPSNRVRMASTTRPSALPAASPIAPSSRSHRDEICKQAKSNIMTASMTGYCRECNIHSG
ncbi:hypothetical protein C241_05047 [Bradyrhizobium lupini HPC(L)]|uniref:Uncharacterized protein n=1 Tax=Bradyrhizobium lupini HPC(L) TaxID=1229491 RepID=A0ABP2RUK8_RHILU|nr:hypothetical protein C241_05047 [Bradyrhizobium lupini HPC(L)]